MDNASVNDTMATEFELELADIWPELEWTAEED
jgi:hypothetical protein